MKIQLYGGPRDGQEYDLGEAPFPNEVEVQLCWLPDYLGSDINPDILLDLVGKTTTYRNAGCGVHYVHEGMAGHQV